MSEIPYYFETPVPKYFRENGWFDNEHMFKYVHWAFSRCSSRPHKIVRAGKELTLAPFEFLSGRLSSPTECFLTENVFRNQQKALVKAGLLKKTTNSLTNHFTAYVWVTDIFCKNNNQPNNQPITNREPTVNHDPEVKNLRIKERTSSSSKPPSTKPPMSAEEMMDELNDFFPQIENSSKAAEQAPAEKIPEPFDLEKFKPQAHKIKKENREYIEVYPGVSMTLEEYGECIQVKGSREAVLEAVTYIMTSTSRTRKIRNWPNAMAKWLIPKSMVDNSSSNELRSRRLEAEWEHNSGWRCLLSIDPKKGDRGLLFFNSAAVGMGTSHFVGLKDPDFNNKVDTLLRDKKMQKSRVRV